MTIKIAVAGIGAVGSVVTRALIDGIPGFTLTAVSDLDEGETRRRINRPDFDLPFITLEKIANHADWIVEALPAKAMPALARAVLGQNKTLVAISSGALLLNPDLREMKTGRILLPAGAIAGMDGVTALAEQGIRAARLTTTKPPGGFAGTPHAATAIRTRIFAGHALAAAAAFPANINVAATLSMATRLDPEQVQVEIWADPAATGNTHEIHVEGAFSTFDFRIANLPDPSNPKSSALTALSIVALLRRQTSALALP